MKKQQVHAPQFGVVPQSVSPKLQLVVNNNDDKLSVLEMAKAGWVTVVGEYQKFWCFAFHRPLKSEEERGRVQFRDVIKGQIKTLDVYAKDLLADKVRGELKRKYEAKQKRFNSLSIIELEKMGSKFELVGRGGEKNLQATVKFTSPCGRFTQERNIFFWATPWGEEEKVLRESNELSKKTAGVMRPGKTARDLGKGGPKNPTGRSAISGPKKGPSPSAGNKNKGFKKR